jgi:Uma2 family endonuclease
MREPAEKPMSIEEFLTWAEERGGKWELHDGAPVAMAPEQAQHSLVKTFVGAALTAALRRSGARCGVYTDGLAVQISSRKAFVPDLLVTCPPTPANDMATKTPLIVVEILSPSTAAFDHGAKLEGYFSRPSLAHCLLIDPERRVLILHSRGQDGMIETRIRHDGEVRLDPPGVALEFADLFG